MTRDVGDGLAAPLPLPVAFRGLVVDRKRRTVWLEGVPLMIGAVEVAVLAPIVGGEGAPVDAETLRTCRGPSSPPMLLTTVRSTITRLRRKLGSAFGTRVAIESVPGTGWRIVVSDVRHVPGPNVSDGDDARHARVSFRGLVVDRGRQTAWLDGEAFPVGPIEVDVFARIVAGQGAVVGYDALRACRGPDVGPLTHGDLRNAVTRLKRKLQHRFGSRVVIQVVRGEGCRIVVPDAAPHAIVADADGSTVRFGGLVVDRDRQTVALDGVPHALNAVETAVMASIVAGRGAPVGYGILTTCRGLDAEPLTNEHVRITVSGLRRKLEPWFGSRVAILQTPRQGYGIALQSARAGEA